MKIFALNHKIIWYFKHFLHKLVILEMVIVKFVHGNLKDVRRKYYTSSYNKQ